MEPCDSLHQKFLEAAKEMWGADVIDKINFTCEVRQSTDKDADTLAGLRHSRRCRPMASRVYSADKSHPLLYRYCKEYTLRLSPRILTLDPEGQMKMLKHEALHIGYDNHGEDFRRAAAMFNIPLTELGWQTGGVINVQAKIGSRFKTIDTATSVDEGRNKAREYHRLHLNEKVRLIY